MKKSLMANTKTEKNNNEKSDDGSKMTSQKKHLEKVKYLYEKWRQNRKLYEEQLKTGKDNGIYFCKTKQRHKNFLDFTPLNVKEYIRDWELEND